MHSELRVLRAIYQQRTLPIQNVGCVDCQYAVRQRSNIGWSWHNLGQSKQITSEHGQIGSMLLSNCTLVIIALACFFVFVFVFYYILVIFITTRIVVHAVSVCL